MNYSQKILAYLGEPDRFLQVYLIAGAPPVENTESQFNIIINTVLTPEDIRDTLVSFASHSSRLNTGDLGQQGVFAFGLPSQGRFKVHYLTQRGTPFVSIQRMPFDIPKLETLLVHPGHIDLMQEVLGLPAGGIVIFAGTSADTLTRLLYAALSRINDTQNKIIYILEQSLSYLMKHRNSIVIQVEVGTDVPTLSEGIHSGLFLAPDLVYVSNPKTQEEFASLICAAQAGASVLVSMIAINETQLLADLEKRLQDDFPLACHFVRKTITVTCDQAGLISLTE